MNTTTETAAAGIGHNLQIGAYDDIRKAVAECKLTDAGVKFDYADKKGNTLARSHVFTLRKLKGVLDKVRVSEKADSLALGKRIDAQAGEILGDIEAMIERHVAPLKKIEDAEAYRVEQLEAKIARMVEHQAEVVAGWTDTPLEQLKADLEMLEGMDMLPPAWDEFHDRAVTVHLKTVQILETVIERREEHAQEQSELETLRVEKAKRVEADRIEAEKVEAKRIADQVEADRLAEEERIRDEEKAEAEAEAIRVKEAATKRENDLKVAAEKAEADKVAATKKADADRVQAVKDRAQAVKDAEAKVKREATEAAARETVAAAKREANVKHHAKINNAAVKAMCEGGMSEVAAKHAVTMIAKGVVPHVAIRY